MVRRSKVKYLFISLIGLLLFSSGYALLSTKLSISGIVSGSDTTNGYIIDSDSNPNLEINSLTTNCWQEGSLTKCQYTFNVKNIGTTPIDNLKITITFNKKITSIVTWNYTYDLNQKILILERNYVLNANQSVEASFIAASQASDYKISKVKLEIRTVVDEIDPSQFPATFTISNGWGNYTYQYNVNVTNKTGNAISYWQITIDLGDNTNYISGWNAIFNTYGNSLVIKNASHNGNLNNNASTTFGLQLQTSIQNYKPVQYSVVVR